MPTPQPIIKQLVRLPATKFEQLTFDLVIAVGLHNAVWRTPGADGGRDIEGDYPSVDMTGTTALQRWYVECKRYSATVDWPTVHPKLAYAQNRAAQFLLLVTTAHLSPQCKSEIDIHNAKRVAPSIRVWDATTLGRVVAHHPQLLVKYGLSVPEKQVVGAFLPLSLAAARATQAAYGAASSGTVSAPLEFAAAASELLWVRVKAAANEIPPGAHATAPSTDLYGWLTVESSCDLTRFDRYGLRAIVTAIRYVTGAATVTAKKRASDPPHTIRIRPVGGTLSASAPSARNLLRDLSLWSNIHVRVNADGTIILERNDG